MSPTGGGHRFAFQIFSFEQSKENDVSIFPASLKCAIMDYQQLEGCHPWRKSYQIRRYMNINFRELNYDNNDDRQIAVVLLNEFMNMRHNNKKIEIDIMEKIKALGYAKVYFCADGDTVIGIAVCFKGFSTFKQRELLNIHDFYIRSDYQGQGIGKMFIKYIEDECKKNGLCRVTLEVYNDNPNAIKLYKKCGFIGSENSESDCLVYAMKKDLM